MHHGLQDLKGEVARLRAECDYFLNLLGELERLSDFRLWISDEQEEEIRQANRTYSWSAKENLEHATNDLRNWWGEVNIAVYAGAHQRRQLGFS